MAYSPESRKLKYQKRKELMKVDPEVRLEANRKRNNSRKRRITAKLFEVGFDISKLNTGICCYVDCTTKLSRYNQDYCCGSHQTKVVKDGLSRIMESDNTYGLGFKKEEY